MNKNIIKVIVMLFIFGLIYIFNSETVNATASIELVPSTNSIEEDKIINVILKIKDQINGISGIDMFINYDDNTYEKLQKSDIKINNISDDQIDTFSYNEDTRKLIITFSDCMENIDEVLNISFKAKSDISGSITNEIYFSHLSLYNVDYDIYELFDVESPKISFKSNDGDELYLSSDKYRIGETNVFDYEEGDKYITKISPNTTLADFKLNCKTNGNITVYKQDGEELGDDEYIGTGMTLVDELNGETITITLIVMGDVNGNGKIDTSDLTSLRGALYEGNELDDIALKALDIEYRNIINTKVLTILRNVLYEGGII